MKHRLAVGLGLGAAVAALAWVYAAREVGAQDPVGPAAPPDAPDFPRTALEEEVWTLYGEHKLITARRKVEELLEQEPDSILGNFVFGNILREAEGSLPQAAHHLGRARELYESQWPVSGAPPPGAPWLLHREILYSMQMVAGEMEKHEYRLQMLDFYDSLYDPNLVAEHTWPLMKLGRFDEARELANRAIGSSDAFQRSLGRNALCALEGEARQREPRFTACLAAFEDALDRSRADAIDAPPDERTSVAVHAYNAALAAHAVLRPDEVERLAIEGARRLEFTPANPWRLLADLYTAQGRMDDAVKAVREMQSWRARQPAWLRDQDRAESDGVFATVMLVAGETETGLRAVARALERPDRRGLTSSDPEQALGAHALLRRALARTHAEVLAERASYSGTATGWEHDLAALGVRARAMADDERIVAVLADDERLAATFRMYVQGGIEPVPAWLLGDLVDVLGAGTVEVVLGRVREQEELPAFDPYYDAIEAEVALARGDPDRALQRAQAALDALPETERLLRARVAAVASIVADERGDEAARLGFLRTALENDAGVVRRLELALPARIESRASGTVAARAVELLGRSPRLSEADGGFSVVVEGAADELVIALYGPDGGSIVSARPAPVEEEPEDPPDDEDQAAMLVEAFHRQAFAMPIGLSNIDLGSLDGTAVINEDAARDRMAKILDDLVEAQN